MVSNGCCLVKAYQSGSWAPDITLKAARLEVSWNFFSQRVTSEWNKIPSEMKNGQQCGYIQERFFEIPCQGGLISGEMGRMENKEKTMSWEDTYSVSDHIGVLKSQQ
jgi:hypothetical protein